MYKHDELRKTFGILKSEDHAGVRGVIRIKAARPGPTLGITVCTHGNEPSGLAAARYLLEELDVRRKLQRGTLYLVVNNLRAAEKYLKARTDDARKRARYIDVNMNRLPERTPALAGDSRYEVRRARELLPIWRQFDIGLDIHSMSQRAEPMIITRGTSFHRALFRGFPIEAVLSNIDRVQIGAPAFAFYGRKGRNIPVFEIESGSHRSPDSFRRAAHCAHALLRNLRMLPGRPEPVVSKYRKYAIADSVVFPNRTFRLVKKGIRNFTVILRGTELARGMLKGKATIIRARFDGHVFFCDAKARPANIKEEVMFLSIAVQ